MLAYRALAQLRRLYWFVFRPRTSGVKTVVEHNGRWLMIRHSYGRGHWTFPGGTVGRRETPDAAATREVREEVGLSVTTVIPIGVYRTDREYKKDTVHIFRALVDVDELRINPREVAEATWVLPDKVPPHGPVVAAILDMLREDTKRK